MTQFYFGLKSDFLPFLTRSSPPTPRLRFGFFFFFFSMGKMEILVSPPNKCMLSFVLVLLNDNRVTPKTDLQRLHIQYVAASLLLKLKAEYPFESHLLISLCFIFLKACIAATDSLIIDLLTSCLPSLTCRCHETRMLFVLLQLQLSRAVSDTQQKLICWLNAFVLLL